MAFNKMKTEGRAGGEWAWGGIGNPFSQQVFLSWALF